MKKLFMIAAVVALATVSFAQRQGFGMMGGGGNPMMLLTRPDVQEDLKLTDDQKSKLSDIQTDMRDQMRAAFQDAGGDRTAIQKVMQKLMESSGKKLNEVLKPEQQTRLLEIFVQISGNSAILNADVQKKLELKDDQIVKIKDLQKKQQEAGQKIREKVQSGEIDRDQVQEIMKKNTDVMNTELGKLLTDAQRDKLKSMGGAPFKKSDNL